MGNINKTGKDLICGLLILSFSLECSHGKSHFIYTQELICDNYGQGRIQDFLEGADFKKNFENFCDLFIFRALPKHYKDFVLAKVSGRRQNFEKTGQKRRF